MSFASKARRRIGAGRMLFEEDSRLENAQTRDHEASICLLVLRRRPLWRQRSTTLSKTDEIVMLAAENDFEREANELDGKLVLWNW